MKVLHILYSGLGGHGNVFFSMVDADIEKTNDYEALFFGIEEVREGYIEKANQRNIPWHFVQKKAGFDKASYKKIVDIIGKSQPDIIFLHSSAYIFPARKAVRLGKKKMKIVVRETQPNHLKTKLEWVGLCFALLVADKVVFLSTEYRDAIKKTLRFFFSEKRTAVIPNGVDLQVYKPAAAPPSPFIKIGMQSRLSGTKDHATLIEAFYRLQKDNSFEKPLQLFLAGDGECAGNLKAQVQQLGISDSVIFTGMLEEKALPAFINSLDIYVHATLGETMSTAIMQVMACAVPVIASDVLGVNNMIKHQQNGLLVPAKDPEKLSQAMRLFIQDRPLAIQMAKNALAFAEENYSNKKMLNSYNSIFKALTSN